MYVCVCVCDGTTSKGTRVISRFRIVAKLLTGEPGVVEAGISIGLAGSRSRGLLYSTALFRDAGLFPTSGFSLHLFNFMT